MVQYRLTNKFAKDIKIKDLQQPQGTLALLDDWVIDVIIIQRKKVAVLTHVKSVLTLFLPYSMAGGAKNIIELMPALTEDFLRRDGYETHIKNARALFKETPVFCKTDNRQILGHMNDIKRCVKAKLYDIPFNEIDWDKVVDYVYGMPINVRSLGFTSSREILYELLQDEKGPRAH